MDKMKLDTELEQLVYRIWDYNSETGEWPEFLSGVSELINVHDSIIKATARAEALSIIQGLVNVIDSLSGKADITGREAREVIERGRAILADKQEEQ